VPIEELLFNFNLSFNRTEVYADKGFNRLHFVNWTNRKVFRLILYEPVKTIANCHEIWMLREIEGVEISDSLDVRSAFAPAPSAKSRHMPSVPRVTPSNILPRRHCPEPCNARAKKAFIE
jgi:hypothetical protein